MGSSVDEFNDAHPDTEAGSVVAAGRLTQLVEQGRGLAASQREGLIDRHAAAAQKKAVRDAMLAGPIAHLAAVGELAAREQHELGKTFRFKPSADTYIAFRTAAGTMAAAAQTHKEVLIKYGLSESVLEKFVQLINQFDEAVALGNNGRRVHTGATRELEAVATEIARIVRVMDARNRERFQSDGQLLGSWINARTVLGTPRRGSKVTTPGDTVPSGKDGGTPAPAGDVRPAA